MTYALESIDPFYAACLKLPASPRQDEPELPEPASTPGCRWPRRPPARCRT